MYVNWLAVNNLRCFEQIKLQLCYPGGSGADHDGGLPNVNLLLGINGAGKTTILKALALATLSVVVEGSGYRPYYLVRRTPTRPSDLGEALAVVMLQRQDLLHTKEETQEDFCFAEVFRTGSGEVVRGGTTPLSRRLLVDDGSAAMFVVGYGATRRVESAQEPERQSRKRRSLRYQRVAGLFEDYIGLTSLAAWMAALNGRDPRRFREVVRILNRLLPSDTRFTGRFHDDEPVFRQRRIPLPFGALSDGYRAYIGLVGDLLYHLQKVCPARMKLTQMRGLVLIDDIELHLHPSWQRLVVPTLAQAFPNLQFVLTSHSPLVAGTLHARNIFRVETDERGVSYLKSLQEPIHGLTADQVLISSYFGLDTTRAPDSEKKLHKLAERMSPDDKEASLAALRELADGIESLARENGPEK